MFLLVFDAKCNEFEKVAKREAQKRKYFAVNRFCYAVVKGLNLC